MVRVLILRYKMKKLILLFSIIFIFTINFFSQTNESIRIGVFADMSGATSIFGESTYNGVKMAIEEINASGGINGRKIEIYLEDDRGTPEMAKRAVERLISEKKVHAIIGEVASSNSLAAAPVAQEARIPMISPSSTNPKVTEVGNYIFRACFIDPFQGEAMAKFVFNELKLRRVAIFKDNSSDYSKGLSENFTKTFTRLGGKVLTEETYAQRDSDFRFQLKAIRSLKPDAIYLPGYYGEIGEIARQVRELKMNLPLLGADGWDSPELWKLGGEALNNSYITNHYVAGNPDAKAQNFIIKYKSEFDSEPNSLAALGYDAAYMLAEAISRAGSTDGKDLRDALAQTYNFNGVTGATSLNSSRNAVKPAVILKLNTKTKSFDYYSTVQP